MNWEKMKYSKTVKIVGHITDLKNINPVSNVGNNDYFYVTVHKERPITNYYFGQRY